MLSMPARADERYRWRVYLCRLFGKRYAPDKERMTQAQGFAYSHRGIIMPPSMLVDSRRMFSTSSRAPRETREMTGPELRMMALELKHAVAAIERACLLAQGSELRPTWTACLKRRRERQGERVGRRSRRSGRDRPHIARASATARCTCLTITTPSKSAGASSNAMGSALPRPEGLLKMEYVPREQFVPFHKREQRHSVLVTHRRCGKTVASICDLIGKAIKHPPARQGFEGGRFAYIATTYAAGKDIAWEMLALVDMFVVRVPTWPQLP